MDHPNYSGTWLYNPRKSNLQVQPPDSTTFIIEHTEPIFILTRTHVTSGKSDTITVTLKTDGEEVSFQHGGLNIRGKLHWQEDMLVFHSEISRNNEIAINIVKYRLEEKGATFIAEEKLNSAEINYENKWVFDKDKQ